MVTTSGEVLGEHPGIQFFTIGQRRRLGLQGNTGAPMYVVEIDTDSNRVVLGREDDLLRRSFWASRVNFTAGDTPSSTLAVDAKIRYKSGRSAASVVPHGDWAEIRFDTPQRAVTPGQAVVFYRGEEVLGGGIIELEPPSVAA